MTPLMLIAGEGLLQNTGLGISTDLQSKIATCEAADPANAYKLALSAAYTNDDMFTFANDTCPAITNAIPDSYTSIDPEVPEILASDSTVLQEFQPEGATRLTDLLEEHSNNILGNGDLSKYASYVFSSQGQLQSSNEILSNASAANTYLGSTFTNFDDLTTGGISSISLAFDEFGNDMIGAGAAIDFANLQYYGTPQGLVTILTNLNLLEFVYPELIAQGINPDAVKYKISNAEQLSFVVQKKCYEAFKTVTGQKLATMKTVLRVTSADVTSLADLLNTFKLFPRSRQTLNSVTRYGRRSIYVNNTGSVNEQFKELGKDYYSVMPKDVCDANVAFRRSLQQVKNISAMNSTSFGTTISQLESNYGLDAINSLTQALPADTHEFYTNTFAANSASNIAEFIGSPAGIVHTEQLSIVNENIAYLNAQGALDEITTDFTNLAAFCNTVLDGITPVSIPGYSSYLDHDSGIAAVLVGVTTKISTLTTNYPTQVAALNGAYNEIAAHINTEQRNLTSAGIDFSETIGTPSSIQNLVSNLHSFGTQSERRGIAEVLEKTADLSTRAGQALVAALREGRNLQKLDSIGIQTDMLPPNVTQPTDSADISQGKYSLTEALNSVILD